MTKLVLLKLADNANDEGECWPSIRRIVNETGLARSTVLDRLTILEKDGIITRRQRETESTGNVSTLYWISLDEILKNPDEGGGRHADPPTPRTPHGPGRPPGDLGGGRHADGGGGRHADPKHNIRTVRKEPSKETPLALESQPLLVVLPDLTDEIYRAYPRKVGRKPALAAIRSALKRCAPTDLLAATRAYASGCRTVAMEERFIPHPATWFNQDRWNDPIPQLPHGPRDASSLTSDEKQRF